MAAVGKYLGRLLEQASQPLGAEVASGAAAIARGAATLPRELDSLLQARDGFYAFESALHVFPLAPRAGRQGLVEWNSPELWRAAYQGTADLGIFFAEDIFGGQFCLGPSGVETFDPETGEREPLAESLEDWARQLLQDYEVLTGFPLAHEWQTRYGALSEGRRLVPKIPFVMGGEFAVENLHDLEAVRGMRLRAEIALQIRDLPDGSQIRLGTA